MTDKNRFAALAFALAVLPVLAAESTDPSKYAQPVDFSSARSAADKANPPHENSEWLEMFASDVNKHDLPHVIFIGDSICGNYYPIVQAALKGKAYTCGMRGSACVGDPTLDYQLRMMLERFDYDIIHINNGLHGFTTPDDKYEVELEKYLRLVQKLAPRAKVIWATSTPIRNHLKMEEFRSDIKRVIARNEASLRVCRKLGITRIDDLWAHAKDHPEWMGADGVHFKHPEGRQALAQSVIKSVEAALAEK